MGMDGYKNQKEGKIKFLKDYNVSYGHIYKKDEVVEKVYWPDKDDSTTIWWNEGMGDWYNTKIGETVEIIKE